MTATIYSKELNFLRIIYGSFDCGLTGSLYDDMNCYNICSVGVFFSDKCEMCLKVVGGNNYISAKF